MARKTLNQILADIQAAFPDNNTKLITPVVLRTFLDDLVYAIRPSYAILRRDSAVAQAITTLPAPLVFTSADLTYSLGEYTANALVGRVTRLDPGVVSFQFTADVSSPSNSPRVLTFTLYKDGVATAFRQSIQLAVSGEVLSVSFPALASDTSAADYDMYIQSSVNETITFSNMVLIAQTIPANS